MTQTFWAFPALAVKPARKRALKGVFHKYDHWQMLQDRMAGMSWRDIAAKHKVCGTAPDRQARRIAFRSNACKRLSPEEVERLMDVGYVKSRKA